MSMMEAVADVAAPSAARAVDLRKVYGEGDATVEALAGVSIEFAEAEFTAIMGPSGSGKSTLLHCMAALDRPTSGKVFIGDVDLTTLNEKQTTLLRREKVGFVFQAFNLVPTLTAQENITLPLDIAGTGVDRSWFDTVVDAVGLRDRLGHVPSELSGGQQQRVAVARPIVTNPPMILADQPTGNLDSHSTRDVLDIFEQLNREGRTIVLITHEDDVASFATRVVRLDDGHVVSDAPQRQRAVRR